MIDEIFDRQYRAGRAEFNKTLIDIAWRLGESVGHAFKVLNRIEYSAPWAAKARRARSN
ncbi:MAG TPA: hypothetical protein VM711_06930 [Sphingomicrobium sp.]|nr:hypothetical protein [Sphingomicrobium sp.]